MFLAVLAAGLFWTAPALADYLGPDRTVVTWVWRRLECEYNAQYDPPEPGYYSCMLYRYYTPDASCPATSEVAGYFTPSACSWPEDFCRLYGCSITRSSDIVSCTDGQQGCRAVERQVTHPEATISGSIGCGTAGSGGWCRGGAELVLSGSEPLAGYEILLVEGTRNGEVFACPGASCSIPLAEGWNEFSYWALSSWGDSSRMGSTSGGLDSRAPSLAGEASGTPGEGGWYVSEVTISASASDPAPGSGLAGLEVRLDGGGWGAYGGPLVLYDGVHSLELRASDVAGNTASLSQTISVDTGAPAVALSAAEAFCPRCGESLEITIDAQDGVSGVVQWRLSADSVEIAGGSSAVDQIVSWDGGGISGGAHTLTLWAADAAGNEAEASQPLTVEVPPAPASEPTDAAPLILAPLPSPTATVTRTPAPTRTAATFTFGGLPAAPPPEEGALLPDAPPDGGETAPAVAPGGGSGVLWGGAALALIGLATAFAIEQAHRRKQEEAAERAEMLKANAEAEARDQALQAWQAAVAWAAKQEAERQEEARQAAAERDRFEQQLLDEDRSLKEFVRAQQQEERRLEPEVAPAPAPFDLAKWKQQDYAAYEASQQAEALELYRASEHGSAPGRAAGDQGSWVNTLPVVANLSRWMRDAQSSVSGWVSTARADLSTRARSIAAEVSTRTRTARDTLSTSGRSLRSGGALDLADIATAALTYAYVGRNVITGNPEMLVRAERSAVANDVVGAVQFLTDTLPMFASGLRSGLGRGALRQMGRVGFLGRLSGWLAIPLGGWEFIDGGYGAFTGRALLSGEVLDTEQRWIGGVRALSGFLAAAGGVLVVVGGAGAALTGGTSLTLAGIGLILLGVSAVINLGATVHENRVAVGEFLGVGTSRPVVDLPPPQLIPTPDLRPLESATPTPTPPLPTATPQPSQTSSQTEPPTPIVTQTPEGPPADS